jgi:putative hemolysin
MSTTDPGFTDQQIRSIASALRARTPYGETHRADELDAAVALEQLYRERGSLIATLERVRHAVDFVALDGQIPAAGVQVLRDALDEVAW